MHNVGLYSVSSPAIVQPRHFLSLFAALFLSLPLPCVPPSVCSSHGSPACAEVEGGELSNFTAEMLLNGKNKFGLFWPYVHVFIILVDNKKKVLWSSRSCLCSDKKNFHFQRRHVCTASVKTVFSSLCVILMIYLAAG